MTRVLAFALLAGCYAAPPPPADPGTLSGCHPGSYGELSELSCGRDDDCLLCATDDAPCGALSNRQEVALANPPCPAPEGDGCAGARAACCEGRCVRSLGPPPL